MAQVYQQVKQNTFNLCYMVKVDGLCLMWFFGWIVLCLTRKEAKNEQKNSKKDMVCGKSKRVSTKAQKGE